MGSRLEGWRAGQAGGGPTRAGTGCAGGSAADGAAAPAQCQWRCAAVGTRCAAPNTFSSSRRNSSGRPGCLCRRCRPIEQRVFRSEACKPCSPATSAVISCRCCRIISAASSPRGGCWLAAWLPNTDSALSKIGLSVAIKQLEYQRTPPPLQNSPPAPPATAALLAPAAASASAPPGAAASLLPRRCAPAARPAARWWHVPSPRSTPVRAGPYSGRMLGGCGSSGEGRQETSQSGPGAEWPERKLQTAGFAAISPAQQDALFDDLLWRNPHSIPGAPAAPPPPLLLPLPLPPPAAPAAPRAAP